MKHTNLRTVLVGVCFLLLTFTSSYANDDEKLLILLIGDSTTEGLTPRNSQPEGPHLEQIVANLLACEDGVPAAEVINLGKGGETAASIFNTNRYAEEVAPYIERDVDYIFVRYGINDWYRLGQDVDSISRQFPKDLRYLFERIAVDFPEAELVPMTVIPYMPERNTEIINNLIKSVVSEKQLPLFDIFEPYYKFNQEQGVNSLTVREMDLDKIPAKYHSMLESRIVHYTWGNKIYSKVVSDDNELDALLGEYEGWYSDRHPNLAGYNLIGKYTVEYILNDLSSKK
ncbi:MAG: SGNH/GDSL hydrolase family protein [Bacteroidales bacterium]